VQLPDDFAKYTLELLKKKRKAIEFRLDTIAAISSIHC